MQVFTGGGEMGELIWRRDWSGSALGPADSWSAHFKSSLTLCLTSAYPIAIYWGPDLRLFYNDAWRPIVGDKHPWALGRPGRDVWPEIWDIIDPQCRVVLETKQGFFSKDRVLYMERYGFIEECYFDYSFTPILGPDGTVEGILNIGMETTHHVLSERRATLVRRLVASLAGAGSPEEACRLAAGVLAEGGLDVPFAAFHLMDSQGCPVPAASVGMSDRSQSWPFADVIASRKPTLVENAGGFAGVSGGPWPEKTRQALLLPIEDAGSGRLMGIMLLGISPRLVLDGAYRDFLRHLASALTTAIAKVRAYEDEKRMRREAEEARQRLALMYEGAGAVGWDINLKTGKVTRSGSVQALYGRATAPDFQFWDIVHPDDQEPLRRAMAEAVSAKGAFQKEFRIFRPDGEVRWLTSKGRAILGADGAVERLAGVNLDVTEKRLTQEALKRQAEKLQRLATVSVTLAQAKSTPELLRIATDEAARILEAHQSVTSTTVDDEFSQSLHTPYLSPKYEAWKDYDAKPDGSGIYGIVCRANRPMRLTQAQLEAHPAWKAFGEQGTQHPPLRGWLAAPLVGRDGRNLGLMQLSDKVEGDFTAEDEAVLVQISRLVSTAFENLTLIEKIQIVNERLREADRRKDEFLAVVSHELRSPLNVIAGHAQLLRMEPVGSRDFRRSLDVIERSTETQAQLISDLLDISRIVTGKFVLDVTKFECQPVLEAAVESVRFAAESKGVVITTHFDPSIGAITADATRIQQLVWNLLANAVKFTPSGGFVLLSAWRRGDQVDLVIADTGQGINPEFLPYAFERFHQEDASKTRKYGGLGLGLAIARYIAELHGGVIGVTSEGKNKGATFTVTLPLRQRAMSTALIPEEAPPSQLFAHSDEERGILEGLRVLVIDDQEDARDMVVRIYKYLGAEVTVVVSAADALAALRREEFNLIVCDIGMPDMNGLQFIRHWRQYERVSGLTPIPAIALTAYASPQDNVASREAGFQCHLAKPVKIAALSRVTGELCGRASRSRREEPGESPVHL